MKSLLILVVVLMLWTDGYQCAQEHECRKMFPVGTNMSEILTTKLIDAKLARLRQDADKILIAAPEKERNVVIARLRSLVKSHFQKPTHLKAFEHPKMAIIPNYLDLVGTISPQVADIIPDISEATITTRKLLRAVSTLGKGLGKFNVAATLLGGFVDFFSPTNANVINAVNRRFNKLSKQIQQGFHDLSKQTQESFQAISKQMVDISNEERKLMIDGFKHLSKQVEDVKKSVEQLKTMMPSLLEQTVQKHAARITFFSPVTSVVEDYRQMIKLALNGTRSAYKYHRERFLQSCDAGSNYNQENAIRSIRNLIVEDGLLHNIAKAGHDTKDTCKGSEEATSYALYVMEVAFLAMQNQLNCFGFRSNSLGLKPDCELIELCLDRYQAFYKEILTTIHDMQRKFNPFGICFTKWSLDAESWPADTNSLVDVSTIWSPFQKLKPGNNDYIFTVGFKFKNGMAHIGLINGYRKAHPFYATFFESMVWKTAEQNDQFYFLRTPKYSMEKFNIEYYWAYNPQYYNMKALGFNKVLIPHDVGKEKPGLLTPCAKINRYCEPTFPKTLDYLDGISCQRFSSPFTFLVTSSNLKIGKNCCDAYENKEKSGEEYLLKLCNAFDEDIVNFDDGFKRLYFRIAATGAPSNMNDDALKKPYTTYI